MNGISLTMAFETKDKKKRTFSIFPTSPDVTEVQVRTLATAMITSNSLLWEPETLLGAQLTMRNTVQLI